MSNYLIGLAGAIALASPAYADIAAAESTVEDVKINGQRGDPSLATAPAVVESVNAQTIATSINALTAAEALKYLPSIEVRERYIGDRNGIVSTRTTGTVSSAESLVYADGLLLSNLLGNSYNFPPRWGLVSPSEIARIDVIYGPFSARYPGNSMGGVVLIATEEPRKPELHLAITGAQEGFKLYGIKQTNRSADVSLVGADHFGPLSVRLAYDHLDAIGHPMSFATAGLSTKAATPAATVVTGAYQDMDQNGAPRLVFGGYSIDHSLQDQGKLRVVYDLTPNINLSYLVGVWADTSKTGVDSFLTTAAGHSFYNGAVNIGGKAYTVSGLNPGRTEELHVMNAVSFASTGKPALGWRLAVSDYAYVKESARSASSYGQSTAGVRQDQKGAGWDTADLDFIWRGNPAHDVSFGLHADSYRLRQTSYNLAEWSAGADGSVASGSRGDTLTEAVYVQDRWNILPQWTLTTGLREEVWRAYHGRNINAATTPAMANYAAVRKSAPSPKIALAYAPRTSWETRLSYGRAVRFPTVNELYQQVTSGSTLVQNNPHLLPETTQSYDWTTERRMGGSLIRVSLFSERRRNALFSQTDTTVTPNLTQIENIAAARFRGVEGAFDQTDLLIRGLDLKGSLTWAEAKVTSDAQAPAAVGKHYPRIPTWRGRLEAIYQPTDKLSLSLGCRYSSGAFSTLLNTDVNHGVYGGISAYSVVDVKAVYKLRPGLSLSAGVDNVGDEKYYVSPHPYPQTTGFIGLKFDL